MLDGARASCTGWEIAAGVSGPDASTVVQDMARSDVGVPGANGDCADISVWAASNPSKRRAALSRVALLAKVVSAAEVMTWAVVQQAAPQAAGRATMAERVTVVE